MMVACPLIIFCFFNKSSINRLPVNVPGQPLTIGISINYLIFKSIGKYVTGPLIANIVKSCVFAVQDMYER
jgi:hypothetical protein